MIGFSGFKTQKPRQFSYRPRYYNPEQEAREQRRREVLGEDAAPRAEDEDKTYHPGQYIGELRMRRGIMSDRQHHNAKVNGLRVLILVAIVAAFTGFIFDWSLALAIVIAGVVGFLWSRRRKR